MTDLTTLSLGAGVQSGTLVEMIVEGELPKTDIVLFADTGDEPEYVYEYVDYLCGRLDSVGVLLVVVSAGNMVKDIYSGGRFAAMPLFTRQLIPVNGFGVEAHNEQIGRLRRQCTREYKIEPIERWIRQRLLADGRATQRKNGAIVIKKGTRVETWLGISLDEVTRMKPNKTKWITNRWPLIEKRMTRNDCKQWLQERGLPVPQKSSCRRCPYHDKAHWRDMRDNRPGDWQEVTFFDQDLRNGKLRLADTANGDVFMTEDCLPLVEVDLSTPAENGQQSLDICDEGFCWT